MLIWEASWSVFPVAPVLPAHSLPAKSTISRHPVSVEPSSVLVVARD